MVDIEWALKQLDQVYHSEDHFKLSLAAELAQMYGDERVRLEWKPETQAQVDIGIRREDVTIPVELKYKTDGATVEDDTFDESFELASQGAQSDAHYRIFRDIRRIEEIVTEQGRYGYVVLLTNDANYWSPPTHTSESLHDAFRIHEGRTVEGPLAWREIRGWIRNQGMSDPIDLKGRYQMEWSGYSYRDEIRVSDNSAFRSLVLRADVADLDDD
ncbi:hypothetical protein [Halocatena salina]|uniref:Uncharacterized protein n=1 Tax=Halocatena salina TaxID=2934340 RepID=A0A8U0ABU0_9EURY|nr:hypothetical protein [Halocatena salina]UPM45333.1 hypothetical protein MW046_18860 [Halocatena salina]